MWARGKPGRKARAAFMNVAFQHPRMMRSSHGVADDTSVKVHATARSRSSGLSSILMSSKTQIFSVSGPDTRYSSKSTSRGSGSWGSLTVRRLER